MAAHEGELREFGPKAAGDPLTTPPSILRLAQVAVPWQVGPYFHTSGTDHSPRRRPTKIGETPPRAGRTCGRAECRRRCPIGSTAARP